MKTAVVLALASAVLSAPTRTVENRSLPGLGSGTDSGLDALKSLIPEHSGSFSDLPSLPHFSGLPGLPALGDLPSLSGSGDSDSLPSVPTDLPGFSDLVSPSKQEEATKTEKRQLGGSTANGVTSKGDCKELTFIFARGTGELGNMGSVVGPEVANRLKSLTSNKVTVQGVTYSADAAGNAMLGANGGPIMAKLVKQALSQCPKTKVVLGGYSQGAMVVHNAAQRLSSGQISGAVLFGDPFKAQSVANLSNDKQKEFCAAGDPVCENGFNVMAHLTYGSDATTAAQFLVGAAGLA